MIKLTVTSKEFGEQMHTKIDGEIGGRRSDLVNEVAHILLEFDRLEDDILTDAMGLMLDKLIEERKAND
jgi:hypothetical protein